MCIVAGTVITRSHLKMMRFVSWLRQELFTPRVPKVIVMICSAICEYLSTLEINHNIGRGGENGGGGALHRGEAAVGRARDLRQGRRGEDHPGLQVASSLSCKAVNVGRCSCLVVIMMMAMRITMTRMMMMMTKMG